LGDGNKAFCYPENPWLGEPLDTLERVSVYARSQVPIPAHLPFVVGRHTDGLLFLGHQARGTLPIPFVISMDPVRTEQRDRPALYDFQVVDALGDAALHMSAATAARVLPFLRAKWRAAPPRSFAVGSWSNVVTRLAHRIARDPEVVRAWRAERPLALVCEPLRRGDVHAGNRRRQALAWARHAAPGAPRVQAAFLRLGYPRIEEACEQAGGFPAPITPSTVIQRRLLALDAFAEEALGDLLASSPVPRVNVMDLHGSGWRGIAETVHESNGVWSRTGRRARRRILSLTLDNEALQAELPASSLATYIHERCHAFGGDESAGFSAALTDAIGLIAANQPALTRLKEAWRAATDAGEHDETDG